MPHTPIWTLPYPALSDPPNGPAQLQELAEATETALDTLAEQIPEPEQPAPSCLLVHTGTIGNVPNETNFVVPTWTGFELNGSWNGFPMWSTGSAIIIIRRSGPYRVGAKLAFSNDSDGDERDLYVLKNAIVPSATASIAFDSNTPFNQTGGGTPVDCEAPAVLAAGDQLRAVVWHNAGNALTLLGNTFSGHMRFWAMWAGD
ncbi:hypothetical protein [Prauserella endophytica]|uniref:Inclusion body protein n=1 Tax=Prauserella endophytica TaxID=1592324 RepID=A0ABY2RS74_9PSEU|nr:hypothetical protein [Prauserella endophytica]TKG58107.1 hypothetical protein FCN18_38445 [Prauserella endophytica]